jgi:hypothetical protein
MFSISHFIILIMSAILQKRRPFNTDFSRKEKVKMTCRQVRRVWGMIPLFFVKKSLTKTDRCVGGLSWLWNQNIILYFSGRFFLTASERQRRKSMYVSLFTVLRFLSCSNLYKLYHQIPVNYTSEGNFVKPRRIKTSRWSRSTKFL